MDIKIRPEEGYLSDALSIDPVRAKKISDYVRNLSLIEPNMARAIQEIIDYTRNDSEAVFGIWLLAINIMIEYFKEVSLRVPPPEVSS